MKIVALIGKAGAGKDTILKKVLKKYPNYFNEIISCTTRPPREGEQDGVNYHFLTVPEFTEKILNGDMLEATEFNGWHYGTALSDLSKDKINIGVFNPAGIYCMLEDRNIDLDVYLVQASAKNRLIRQLTREDNPNINEIFRRFNADEEDFFDISDSIDYTLLLNDTTKQLESAVIIIGADQLN